MKQVPENAPTNSATHTVQRRVARLFGKKGPDGEPALLSDQAVEHAVSFRSARRDRASVRPKIEPNNVYILKEHELTNHANVSEKLVSRKYARTGKEPWSGNNMNNTLAIYTTHFGLTARPFSLLPDPDFMFWSAEHRRAYTMLEYGILTCAPITLITGDVGSGKTTLLRHLLNNIDDGIEVGLVSNAHGDRGELLRWVLMSLDQPAPPQSTYVDLFDQFQAYLIEKYADGSRVVIIFDEAQNLSRESLEELRMFTNINANKDELLQLVLVGQPELRDMIRRPDLRQFAQRVAANFHLSGLDATTVQSYIGHRLAKVGATKNLFNKHACELIFQNTGGVPRLVNQLCDLAMVYAFTNNQKTVTDRTVQQVLDDGAFFGAGAFDVKDPSI